MNHTDIDDMMSNITTVMTTTTTTMTSPVIVDDITTAIPDNAPLFIMKQITGDIPEFEIILPCIFGIFIILSLGLMVFYTKNPEGGSHRKGKDMDGKGEHQGDGKTDNSWF